MKHELEKILLKLEELESKIDKILYRKEELYSDDIAKELMTEVINLWNKSLGDSRFDVFYILGEHLNNFRRLCTHLETVKKWREYFNRVSESDFLMGKTKNTNFKRVATLPWVLNLDNFTKINSGQYDNSLESTEGSFKNVLFK